MTAIAEPWDYLIVTAGSDEQAAAYEGQLRIRRSMGLLADVRETVAVADPGGRRVGSGGSTLYCLVHVLNLERAARGVELSAPKRWWKILAGLRILIVHAGGDSKRLPAYSPCGKIFLPVPGESDAAIATTLFDRQIHTLLALPPPPIGLGQVVIASGDVLLDFDPEDVRFDEVGVIGLGCAAPPDLASRHGVYCADGGGQVRRFLQKPSVDEQAEMGAVDRYGQSILDVGVMHLDAATAVTILETFGVSAAEGCDLACSGPLWQGILENGIDFYREICCAMGTLATARHYANSVQGGRARWDDATLRWVFDELGVIPFQVRVLEQCRFLHFGTTRQMISSGLELLRMDRGALPPQTCVDVGNDIGQDGQIVGAPACVEGCRIASTLTLGGENVVVGVDVTSPLSLLARACLDVVPGMDRRGNPAWFVRCYGVDDRFKDTPSEGATLCDRPVGEWLDAVGLSADDVWGADVPPGRRTLWDAALFPASASPSDAAEWSWMFEPGAASAAQKRAYLEADRYSSAEIASRTDLDAFHSRRARIHAERIRRSLRRVFRPDGAFSAADLHHVLASIDPTDRAGWVSDALVEARWHYGEPASAEERAPFAFCRIIHTLASALSRLAASRDATMDDVVPGLADVVQPSDRPWLDEIGLGIAIDEPVDDWCERARAAAFDRMGRIIVMSHPRASEHPVNVLRSDEIVWGRAPARLDLGGGWSDTPPYSLEQGGCVINAAVDLNGQPPVHCYARRIDERVVRIGSIDLGARIEIADLDDLLDFRSATSEFALAKAALALSGLSPDAADWHGCDALDEMLDRFGGGVELTTLAAIPKGSGLGTSSIVGAVVLAVVQRMMGRPLGRRELFHGVLRLEQALTTGGGWQDQVGGAVDGVKVITTQPGLVPDPVIRYVPADVLDPIANGGKTLLYYTGIARLAKDILQRTVGEVLDRDRRAMAALRRIHDLPPHIAEAMARKDLAAFGELIDVSWRLNKRLTPDSSNDEVEALLARVRPHIHGAKLLGAGGGGFLLMVCKSSDDGDAVRDRLQADPPNDRARFFDFGISTEGLVVTVC